MKRMFVGAAMAALCLVAAPAFAQSDAPSPQKLELAKQVIDATGMTSQLGGMMHNLMGQAFASTGQNLSPAAKTRLDAIAGAEEDMMTEMAPKIVAIAEDAYARTYSEQELADMLAFYQSPSGRSMTAKAPQLMQNMMGGVFTLMPQMRHDLAVDVCKRMTCTDADKKAMFGAAG